MEQKHHLTITSAVLCEEVRKEENSKHIIIGAYGGNIWLSEFPGNISIALYVEGFVTDLEPANLFLRYSGPGDGSAILKVNYTPNDMGGGLVSIGMPKVIIGVSDPGVFKVELSEDEKNWEELLTRSVTLNPNSATSVPEQPS